MTQNELIIAIAHALPSVTRTVIVEVLRTAGEVTAEVLSYPGEEDVAVPGFGKFKPRRRLPRMGRNPLTGEAVPIKGKRVAQFSPGQAFRGTVAGTVAGK